MQNNNIKISIIVPVYNTEKYLPKCLDSLLNQTYKDIEIICVNDGSTDNSLRVLNEYAKKDNRVKVINQENSGVSAARNNGLVLAKGDYIYFMDSDDTINDIFIESSIKITQKGNADVIIVGLNNQKMTNHCTIEDYYNAGWTWEIITKNNLLKNNLDVNFPCGMQYNEDTIFIHKVLILANKIVFNEKAEYYYNIHDLQLTSVKEKDKDVFKLLNIGIPTITSFYENHNLLINHSNSLCKFIAHVFIPKYWNCNFSKQEKEQYFNILHKQLKKYNYKKYEYSKFTLSNFMTARFVKCKKWQDFEKYLILIKIFKFCKNIVKN